MIKVKYGKINENKKYKYLARPTLLIIMGICIKLSSLSKISKSKLRRTMLNFFLGRSFIWCGISFHNFAPSRENEFFCISNLELLM